MDWSKLKNHKEWQANITGLLLLSDEAVKRAVIAIWKNQTAIERQAKESTIVDKQGFNKYDAPYLSRLAEQLQDTWYLTDKQMACARRKMPKYWKQLMIISKRNLGLEK